MNYLSEETSPYLLQHKNNPVHWHAWNEEALHRAKSENKMMLISIGYSACHWCHVMEHEVFEDDECASFMNQHFICIKVDREERPDVDSVYMDALHIMGRQGGWPLNVFTTPDGRPIYGGTYFPKQSWLDILENLTHVFKNEPQKIEEYAGNVHEGLQQLGSVINDDSPEVFDKDFLLAAVEHWSQYWDSEEGGARKAPKFPMPNNWEFLLHHAVQHKDEKAKQHVMLTLTKMTLGGIYDQVGGGFSRYSVDGIWKVPHFEKMLYDNAQLISLYAQAYRAKKNELFADVVHQTITWLQQEMLSPQGLYYSALDADSEGVEGKFYTWSSTELKEILQNDFSFASSYFRIDNEALWEHDQNILLRTMTDEIFAKEKNISVEAVKETVHRIQEKIVNARAKRIRPGLDDKSITSWNALLIAAFCEAHKSFPKKEYLTLATACSNALIKNLKKGDNSFYHVFTKGQASIQGFLDDYAFTAEAFIQLYEVGGDEQWLHEAKQIVDSTIQYFHDEKDGLFFFTSSQSEKLIARKKEMQDNVIASSNSAMCKVLFRLGLHFSDIHYLEMSKRMMSNMLPLIDFASGYSNWLLAYQWMSIPFYEVVITGDQAEEWQTEMQQLFLPNTIIVASTLERSLPLFQNKFGTKSAIYVCSQNHCLAPTYSVEEAIAQMQ